jgi:hypothetical protein
MSFSVISDNDNIQIVEFNEKTSDIPKSCEPVNPVSLCLPVVLSSEVWIADSEFDESGRMDRDDGSPRRSVHKLVSSSNPDE